MSRPVIVVTGSRSLTDEDTVEEAFAHVLERVEQRGGLLDQPCLLLHGGAGGVDRIVGDLISDSLGEGQSDHLLEVVQPDWGRHGKAAGFIRNGEMVQRAADTGGAVIAIWDGQSKGTYDTIKRAAKLRVPAFVEVVYP
jgi:hypothetical protein